MQSKLDAVQDWTRVAKDGRYQTLGMAGKCGVCERHLRRYFSSHFGIAPEMWIHELRMQLAPRLLLQRALCKEVANELGYPDYATFSHQFKTAYGISPEAYWVMIRTGASKIVVLPVASLDTNQSA